MPENLERRGRVWYGRIEVGGRDIRKSLQTTSKQEARKRLKAWLDDVSHRRFYGDARHTWKQAVGRWRLEYLPGNVAPATAKRYEVSITQLDHILGGLHIDEFDIKTMSKVIADGTAAARPTRRSAAT